MSNPTAAILIIGDEILSGRTQDTNTRFLAAELTKAGIELREVRVVPDEPDAIIGAINALRHANDVVFTSGGIGPTHDDITADAIAAAFDVDIDVRADALAILEERHKVMGITINPARLRMARIPDGATLIENPVSGAPGFKLDNVHVLAGVPSIFQAMVASVLPGLNGGAPLVSRSVRINRGEGDIAG
ncbi:MAG: competence/damage-inducible protein A, partial [Paracoccaceae bacterium]